MYEEEYSHVTAWIIFVFVAMFALVFANSEEDSEYRQEEDSVVYYDDIEDMDPDIWTMFVLWPRPPPLQAL